MFYIAKFQEIRWKVHAPPHGRLWLGRWNQRLLAKKSSSTREVSNESEGRLPFQLSSSGTFPAVHMESRHRCKIPGLASGLPASCVEVCADKDGGLLGTAALHGRSRAIADSQHPSSCAASSGEMIPAVRGPWCSWQSEKGDPNWWGSTCTGRDSQTNTRRILVRRTLAILSTTQAPSLGPVPVSGTSTTEHKG
ncbi:hypothetical protein V496_00269 [Pseudogymnoascus sp. VKM F-4515 (FW-2607)]|nr:hypothetical protein V496_00269 [Pseudogymnoascus sp. VKM F-4515 (FW-2607)]